MRKTRRRIGKRGHRYKRVDIRRHGFRAAFDRTALQRECARLDSFDERSPVFEQPDHYPVAGRKHFSFTGRALQIRDARAFFAVQHDVRSIFTDGDDASRERLRHAANETLVEWARTLRIDASRR